LTRLEQEVQALLLDVVDGAVPQIHGGKRG
jgi:hypothetical protein